MIILRNYFEIFEVLINLEDVNETILSISSILMILVGLLTFYVTMIINAPYGRYSPDNKNSIWGPLINPKLAWVFMESPNLITPLLFYHFLTCRGLAFQVNTVLMGFFLIHYIHRTIIYPCYRMPDTASPMPVTVCGLAFAFCSWNSFQQCLSLLIVNRYSISWYKDMRFQIGMLMAVVGMTINIYGDSVLLKLKKRKTYAIPQGYLFDYISCVNYFGEILEWTGFAIANWNIAAAAFAIYTFSNIGTRGWNHHKWYLNKFKEDYPKRRCAVIPFVW